MYIRPIFNPDLTVNQTDHYWFEEGFSTKDVNKITALTKKSTLQKADVISGAGKNVRDSSIKWLEPNDKHSWIYDTLTHYIQEANSIWKFDLHTVIDNIQYTEYKGGGNHYDWHVDIGPGSISGRAVCRRTGSSCRRSSRSRRRPCARLTINC